MALTYLDLAKDKLDTLKSVDNVKYHTDNPNSLLYIYPYDLVELYKRYNNLFQA